MAISVQTLASIMSTDMNLYAGDPQLLNAKRYSDRVGNFLRSARSDQLTVRVAVHAQMREAFKDAAVQKRLAPFLDNGEQFSKYVQDAKARAKFFSQKQLTLQLAILASAEQKNLKEAHGELAAWEKENAVLLRHQMFMTYMPSQALLLESAATVALYRQYAALEEGEYTSESSDGEVPQQLKKMGGKTYFTQAEQPFEVDEHNKMFSQQVLQNKRVEYEQLRQKVAQLRRDLEECPTVKRLEDFIHIRNEIYRDFGIDRLVSLCGRKDKEYGEPNEGGIDAATMRDLPADDESARNCRAAQYSLPKIVEASHKNYLNILSMDDWDAMLKDGSADAHAVVERLRPLKDLETFRYWFLSSLCADSPTLGPNKIVGKASTTLDDYKKFFAPQKSGYAPAMNAAHRAAFASKVAERRGLPHIVALSPATYRYRENNDEKSVKTGTIDLLVYDMTNEKVLLMVANSSDDRKPRGAFLNAQEERYRFAAVVRSAITYENQYHGFTCSGTVAEYFFDAEAGPEENYYCVMAPSRLTAKQPTEVDVPVKAFRPFTACPPRYFLLGANWGVSAGTSRNPYPASYAHMQLNEDAIALSNCVPEGYVEQSVLPTLPTREEGQQMIEAELKAQQDEEEEKRRQQRTSPRGSLRTPRATPTPRSTTGGSASPRPTSDPATLAELPPAPAAHNPTEEEDPLSAIVAREALYPLRDLLLGASSKWPAPVFVSYRERSSELKELPAVKDGRLRTPLNVFEDLMRDRHGVEAPPADSMPNSSRRQASPRGSPQSPGEQGHKNSNRQVANVVWL